MIVLVLFTYSVISPAGHPELVLVLFTSSVRQVQVAPGIQGLSWDVL